MSTKKSLTTVAAMAFALMGFASSAMAATDGVIRDVSDNTIIPQNTELHSFGWASFLEEGGSTGIECHATSVAKVTGTTGTTGHVSNFSIPDTSKCTGKGLFAGCTVKSAITTNLPYHATVTPSVLDVTPLAGKLIELDLTIVGFLCPTEAKLTISSIILKPLNTTSKRSVTGTAGNLGNTAASGDPIAGFEIEAKGEVHIIPIIFSVKVALRGELELPSLLRCTWKVP